MKKTLALALAMMMAATLLLTGCGNGGSEERVVNVCSWGEYIDEDLIYQLLADDEPLRDELIQALDRFCQRHEERYEELDDTDTLEDRY